MRYAVIVTELTDKKRENPLISPQANNPPRSLISTKALPADYMRMATAISHPTTPRLDDLITADPARAGEWLLIQ
jgi:hypothetical protein